MAVATAPSRNRYQPIARSDRDRARVEECLALQQQMYNFRGVFNTMWQSVAERVQPNYADFTMQWWDGQRRTNKIFDSTAPLALEHFCAALESMICPPSTLWHGLRTLNPKYWGDIQVEQWLDEVNQCLFRARYAPGANFQSQVHECFSQIGAFGNGPMLVDDVMGFGLRYRALHLAETFGMENSAGVIDRIHREYRLTAGAAIDAEKRGMFDEGSLPRAIVEAKDKTQRFTFLQCIYPNPDRQVGAYDAKRFAFTSLHICKEERCLLKESGYETQPILMPRYRVAPKETYGRGPGCDVLPEILSLNEMAKVMLRQAQRAIEPPILLADDGAMGAFDMRGNALNYSMLSADGKPLAVPFMAGANFEINEKMLETCRNFVEKAFLVDIFSVLTQQPNMTATEVLQRAQEKGQLLAPITGRIQSELCGPMISREIDILSRARQLPPPPDKLKKDGKIDLEVVYEGQIQISQRKSKAFAISSVLEQIAPVMQLDPSIAKRLNGDRMLMEIVNGNGAPASILNTDAEQQAKDEAAAQQQQLTNLANMAGPASSAIKNIADAQKASGSALPGNIPGV